jgi:hypothetical protein
LGHPAGRGISVVAQESVQTTGQAAKVECVTLMLLFCSTILLLSILPIELCAKHALGLRPSPRHIPDNQAQGFQGGSRTKSDRIKFVSLKANKQTNKQTKKQQINELIYIIISICI